MSLYEEMFGLVGRLGAQLREGHAAGEAALGAARGAAPASATISALGGSAIGGSLAEALWRDTLRAPTVVNRAAALPGWVGPGHLVVAVSYSGGTAETLAAARSALARGADVIAVTAGDPLGELVRAGGGQVVRVPGGLPPRAALGSLFGALAAVLEHTGVTPPTGGRHPRRRARLRRRRARPRRQPRERARRGGRHDHDVGLRPRPARGGRAPLQEPAEREREVDGELRRAARGRPQRDRRLGRARHAPAAATRRSTSPTPTTRRPCAPASPRPRA